jgi:hypothetical protein
MIETPREPQGQPSGGRFAETPRTEPDVALGTVPRRLDPAVAHHLDHATLRRVLPNANQAHLADSRQELARHIAGRSHRPFATWQDAFNDLTGATPGRDGSLRLSNVACTGCRGKGFDVRHPGRNLARTGNASICGECIGRRRTNVNVRARYAPPDVAASS